jgi:hypothetical protein
MASLSVSLQEQPCNGKGAWPGCGALQEVSPWMLHVHGCSGSLYVSDLEIPNKHHAHQRLVSGADGVVEHVAPKPTRSALTRAILHLSFQATRIPSCRAQQCEWNVERRRWTSGTSGLCKRVATRAVPPDGATP